jgi:hypothetical protein
MPISVWMRSRPAQTAAAKREDMPGTCSYPVSRYASTAAMPERTVDEETSVPVVDIRGEVVSGGTR